MSSGNMICPKCKTFQPAAETCAECGVVVAKLRNPPNARTEPKEKKASPQPSLPSGESYFTYFRPFIFTAVLFIIGGVTMWFFRSSNEALNSYTQAAQGLQQATARNRQLTEEAVRKIESGGGYRGRASSAEDLGFDLHRLAAELNAVALTTTVKLGADDLKRVFKECSGLTNGYFTMLRYGADETYPLPELDTLAYEKGGPSARYQCDGNDGTVYLNETPKTDEGFSTCWSRQNPLIRVNTSSRRKKRVRTWVQMKWDTEANHWAIYSRADQRHVDRERLAIARSEVDGDIDRQHKTRGQRAQKKMPKLIGQVEGARGKLKIVANEETRKKLEQTLKRYERDLKRALVDERYIRICKTAAAAALDGRERKP